MGNDSTENTDGTTTEHSESGGISRRSACGYIDIAHPQEEISAQFEPELLNKAEFDHLKDPANETSEFCETTSGSIILKPNITAFSCTLLLWVISFVIFIVAYFAISRNGLWCPAGLNNDTLVRKGLMISDLDTSKDPCTNIYEYACGGYFKTHSVGSTLYDMQTTNFIALQQAGPFSFDNFSTTSPTEALQMYSNSTSLADFALLGIYPGFEVAILPNIKNPLVYALYIEPSSPPPASVAEYNSIGALPACFSTSTPLANLVLEHLQMGHAIFVARETDLCHAYTFNQTADVALDSLFSTLKMSKWNQLQLFYQNTISTAYAKDKNNAYIVNFVARVKQRVLSYIQTGIRWLDGPSKQKAIEKINQITILVGAGTANIDDCDALNTIACLGDQWKKKQALIGTNVNPLREWKMAATEVNAYYSPLHNHICIPYGIATQPLFSPSYPDSYNMAGLGIIIAHEIAHSIDAYDGVLFDARGSYSPWLTQTASTKLQQYVTCMSAQYERNNMNPALAHLTTDENMADQIAVHSIFTPGTTSTESVVLFAQTWCRVGGTRLRDANTSDPHAASVLRVNTTLEYLPAFQHAFHCPLTPNTCA